MSDKLDKNIIYSFRLQFEIRCVQLLLESHDQLTRSNTNFRDKEENAITAQLIAYMEKNPISQDYKIDITREKYVDSPAAFLGLESPDTSPRIDIRFMTWTSPEKFEYFFEAKNLYENDFRKLGKSTLVNSKAYQQRYIKTGIQNFIDRRYPNGSLVGYVLEGDPQRIADKINDYLRESNRYSESLYNGIRIGRMQFRYHSSHAEKNFPKLTHYFLSFTLEQKPPG